VTRWAGATISEAQVDSVLSAQKGGDTRLFGEIAVAQGLMEESSLKRYLDFISGHDEIEGGDDKTKVDNPVSPTINEASGTRHHLNGMSWFG
jgi:hypothetical protein